jgi:hypothetical protein
MALALALKLPALCLWLTAANAFAVDYTRTVRSGQLSQMHVYRSWTDDCKSKLGVVKVLTRPAHGTLRPSQVSATIGVSRSDPERTAHCRGLPTDGFRVDYISDRGFRGTDRFQIEFSHGRHVDIDNYAINVE